MAASPVADISSDKELEFQSPISLTFTSIHDRDDSASQTPTPLPDLPIPETIPLNNDDAEDLYKEYEEGAEIGGGEGGSGALSPSDSSNPFFTKRKPLPLITGADDEVEIDGPDSLPVLDDPYLTLKNPTADDIEEPEPIARRDRSRSETGERDAALAGLAFATHLALQNKSSGLVREDSSEGLGGLLTLIPATPPPTPLAALSRTNSTSSNVSIRTSSNLHLHTVSEEKMGADGQVNEEEGGSGGRGESEEEVGTGGLISHGSMVINPPTTPMAASSRTFVVPPPVSHPTVPFTPPTTPQNRTSAGAGGSSTTSTAPGQYQKAAGFYKPVKPEVKHRSGGQGVSALMGTVLVSGAPPPTPPVTPANRTSFGHAGRPPPIVSHNNLDPAPTPPPTPMSALATPTGLRASLVEGIDSLIPTISPQIRSRSASSDGFSEMKSQLLSSSSFGGVGNRMSNLMSPTSDDDSAKSPPIVTAPVVACRVAECAGRAFLRGYCPKHWRLARRTSDSGENEEREKESEPESTEEGDQDAPSTAASLEHQFPWLVSSEDGESHWQEWKENLIQASAPTSTTSTPPSSSVLSYGSQEFKTTHLVIQEYLPKTKTNFECSPVPQLITILAGTFIFEASDGKTKTVHPGSVLFLQDLTGKGHRMTVVGSGKHLLSRTSLQALTPSTCTSTDAH